MAKGVNKVFLLGSVGKDPEVRATAGGTVVSSFSLATSDREKDAQGNWQDKTEWHNLVSFARTAEIVRDYVKKGSQLFIEGKIQTRSWDDKQSGEKKYKTEIIVNELSLLGGKSESPDSGQTKAFKAPAGRTQTAAPARTQAAPAARAAAPADDDPFSDGTGISDSDIF